MQDQLAAKASLGVSAPDIREEIPADPPISDTRSFKWKFPDLKDKVRSITINKFLKAAMDDPDVYNWVWSAVAVALQSRDHTTEVPAPEHVRDMFPDGKIYVVRKDEGVVGVMI